MWSETTQLKGHWLGGETPSTGMSHGCYIGSVGKLVFGKHMSKDLPGESEHVENRSK